MEQIRYARASKELGWPQIALKLSALSACCSVQCRSRTGLKDFSEEAVCSESWAALLSFTSGMNRAEYQSSMIQNCGHLRIGRSAVVTTRLLMQHCPAALPRKIFGSIRLAYISPILSRDRPVSLKNRFKSRFESLHFSQLVRGSKLSS